MADSNLTNVRPSHQRPSSTSKPRHQRKASHSISSHLYTIPEKNSHPITTPPNNYPISPAFVSDAPSSSSVGAMHSMTPQKRSRNAIPLWKTLLFRLNAFIRPTSGPLLPYGKSPAFGGVHSKTKRWSLLMSPWFRLCLLLYIVYSVILFSQQAWHWSVSSPPSHAPPLTTEWKLERTYDQDQSYSMMDMTHAHKMSKLFSKADYNTIKNTQPFWLKASTTPTETDLTLVTTVTSDTWPELERLVTYWHGPISATLHLSASTHPQEKLDQFKNAYQANPKLAEHVDVHLVIAPGRPLSVLLPGNTEFNIARLFSRTEYVCQIPINVIPATDIRRTFDANRKTFEPLLQEGDMLVLPLFGSQQKEQTPHTLSYTKARVLELVDEKQLELIDGPFAVNEGPTGLNRWKESTTLYAIDKYVHDYNPIVIESRSMQPWCSERFLDSRAACLLANYLAGGEFWVLPDDFMIRLSDERQHAVSELDRVIEKRLYAKYFWEQCVHHARQLDALGLWKDRRSTHVRKQCLHVIRNWSNGLIGKAE